MASPYTKTSIPERAIKLSSKFCAESPCNGVKEKLKSIVDYSKDEKIEMDKLNSKLSSYLTRVQKLEIENKELIKEIEETKTNWGQQTQDVSDTWNCINANELFKNFQVQKNWNRSKMNTKLWWLISGITSTLWRIWKQLLMWVTSELHTTTLSIGERWVQALGIANLTIYFTKSFHRLYNH